MGNLCTVAELKAWVDIPDATDDIVLDLVIDSAEAWIHDYCGQPLYPVTAQTRTFRACHWNYLELPRSAPLVSVTSLKTDAAGDGTFETTWTASDFQLLPQDAAEQPTGEPYTAIKAIGSLTFPVAYTNTTRSDRVEIVGTFGWPAVPAQVKQACLIQAARLFKRRGSPEGVAGFDSFGVVRVGRLDPDVQAMLGKFRPLLGA